MEAVNLAHLAGHRDDDFREVDRPFAEDVRFRLIRRHAEVHDHCDCRHHLRLEQDEVLAGNRHRGPLAAVLRH